MKTSFIEIWLKNLKKINFAKGCSWKICSVLKNDAKKLPKMTQNLETKEKNVSHLELEIEQKRNRYLNNIIFLFYQRIY
jgi:predicted DNA-binding antitoxin AbrB/MazE fold protein